MCEKSSRSWTVGCTSECRARLRQNYLQVFQPTARFLVGGGANPVLNANLQYHHRHKAETQGKEGRLTLAKGTAEMFKGAMTRRSIRPMVVHRPVRTTNASVSPLGSCSFHTCAVSQPCLATFSPISSTLHMSVSFCFCCCLSLSCWLV